MVSITTTQIDLMFDKLWLGVEFSLSCARQQAKSQRTLKMEARFDVQDEE